jgi:hypothetical protein
VDPGGLRGVYRKAHLWDKERLWFSSGSTVPPVIPTLFGRIAVLICYDLEFPEWVRLPALDGAQLLCAPVNWPAFPPSARSATFTPTAGPNYMAASPNSPLRRPLTWPGSRLRADAVADVQFAESAQLTRRSIPLLPMSVRSFPITPARLVISTRTRVQASVQATSDIDAGLWPGC